MRCTVTRIAQRTQAARLLVLTVSRRGSAPLELMMFMPMYVILLAVFLAIASHSRERTAVTTAVRHQSWMRRGDIGEQTETLPLNENQMTLAGILRGSQEATGGLVQEEGTGQPSRRFMSFIPAGRFHFEHAIVTDPWDHRVLKFADHRQHPALSLDQRCSAFGSVSTGIMSGLGGVSASLSGLAGQLKQQIHTRRQQALREMNASEQRLNQILQDAEQEREGLIDQLRAAEQDEQPNVVLVEDLRRRIQQKQQSIDRVRMQIGQLQEARGYLGRQA